MKTDHNLPIWDEVGEFMEDTDILQSFDNHKQEVLNRCTMDNRVDELLNSKDVEYGKKFMELLSDGYMPIKVKKKVSFVKIPMLSNVAISVRKGVSVPESQREDHLLQEFLMNRLVRPYSFDVLDHLARRIFNHTKAEWSNLEVEVREGFLTLTRQSMMGAIQSKRMTFE